MLTPRVLIPIFAMEKDRVHGRSLRCEAFNPITKEQAEKVANHYLEKDGNPHEIVVVETGDWKKYGIPGVIDYFSRRLCASSTAA